MPVSSADAAPPASSTPSPPLARGCYLSASLYPIPSLTCIPGSIKRSMRIHIGRRLAVLLTLYSLLEVLGHENSPSGTLYLPEKCGRLTGYIGE